MRKEQQNIHDIKAGEVFIFNNSFRQIGQIKSAPVKILIVEQTGIWFDYPLRPLFQPFSQINYSIETALIDRTSS